MAGGGGGDGDCCGSGAPAADGAVARRSMSRMVGPDGSSLKREGRSTAWDWRREVGACPTHTLLALVVTATSPASGG
eukprot:4726021-Prymnesium_polylepis.1